MKTTQSIFTMEMVNEVIVMKLPEAKAYALEKIADSDGVKEITKTKARLAVNKARSTSNLALTMSNWILAHPTEGLKVG